MDKKGGDGSKKNRSKGETTIYGAFYTDPVSEHKIIDQTCGQKVESKTFKKSKDEISIRPPMDTRIELHKPRPIPPGTKYIAPVSKKNRRLAEERRRQYEEELRFCKQESLAISRPSKTTKLDIKLKSPSAEIKQAKVFPRKPSTTPSDLYPDPPTRRDLLKRKPKSGTIINQSTVRKKKRIIRKRPRPPPAREPTIEELIAEELATIEEMGEYGEDVMETLMPENYLTKQFRRKVSQLSKSTSIQSRDLQIEEPPEPPKIEGEEGEEEEEEVPAEEDQFISTLVQKFRRDSEIQRYRQPKRKIKKGTFENFSFTKLKQPTLKTFYYGVKMATIHQGDEHFSVLSRNRQGICIPIAAYCFSMLKHPDKWTQADIDEILEAGNELFLDSAGTQHMHGDIIDLKIQDLQKYCKIGTKKVRFVVSEPEVSGLVRSDDKKIYNLTKAINIFFGRFKAGILQTDTLTVAIWKDKHYYFFDGSPRTLDLFSSEYGTALMANFYDTTSIITVLLNRSNLENTPFIIYSINAYKILEREAEEVDSTGVIAENDNYQVLNEEKAVALGSFDLADKCFGFSRNKQSLTIATIALIYSKITPPSSWHKGTVDKITIIGNQLFLECIENGEKNEVTIDDLPAIFTIGPYLVEIYISPNRFVDFMFKKSKCTLLVHLEKFFATNSNAIVQIENCTIAVWKQRNMYYCFDPYSRNNEALKCRDGVACVSMHTNLTSLINTIAANFDEKDIIFHLHALKVCKIYRDPDRSSIFPKGLTMNDYPIENFKKGRMGRGKRRATLKPVTVDHDTSATIYGQLPDGSIMEVGSDIKSIDIHDLPPMCHRTSSRPLPKMTPPDADFVADLDSPSLSDTQIEPPPLEQPEDTEVEFMDLDSFQLTQEELELEQRGEGEGKGEGDEKEDEEGEDDEGDEDEDADEDEDEEKKAIDLEEAMADESQGAGEEWYMAATDFTQVGSHSLLGYTRSQEMMTDFDLELPQEEVPPLVRNMRAIAKKHRMDMEGHYDFPVTPEPEVTLSEELRKETNFLLLPDDSQIILGTKNMAEFGGDLEIMAPFVCIMAAAVAKKYSIDSWTKDIVDYVLTCGAQLHQSSNTRYDQNYKLEIAKISLGSTDYNIKVDYIFDTYMKPRVLTMAISKMLFPRSPSGILVTPTYSCALFYKNHLYYLYDGFGNNEVGLGKGLSNEGVACFSRFKDIESLVARIIHNKAKREHEENIEYNRFVLSSCHIRLLPRLEPEVNAEEDEDVFEDAEGMAQDEPVTVQTFKKKKDGTEEKLPSKMGYHKVDGLYKIEGTRALGGGQEPSDYLKEDYFVCLCACLLLLNTPLKKWDDKKIDTVIDQGLHIHSHTENFEVCTKKYIKNVLIDDYVFDIAVNRVKFSMYHTRRTLKTGIETMIYKKHEHFILQFPNRCYGISVDVATKTYNLFDPNDKSGKASWTKYTSFRKLVQRIRSGLIRGGESYNFHSFEITSIAKAPRHVIISNRNKKYKMLKERKMETMCKPFYEELRWLDVDPIPWSWKVNKNDLPSWNHWFEDFADDLYSLFGTISPLDPYFPPETRGKQTLGNLVVAIGMTQIYDLADWTVPIIDSVLIYGNAYFEECIKDITNENYELAFDDIRKECRIFPYSFRVKFTPVVEGTIFLVRLKQFNLYKGLRLFFNDYERRFGIICVTKGDNDKRLYAFGKLQESEYFLYDCETLGPPMYLEKDMGVPYILRTTTLNRLLHVMTLTCRGGDFYMFDVGLSELKSYVT